MEEQETAIRDIFEDWLDDEDYNDWHLTIVNLNKYKHNLSISENAKSGIDFLIGTINGVSCNECNEWRAFAWLHNYAIAYVNRDELPLYKPNPYSKKCTRCLWTSVMSNQTSE